MPWPFDASREIRRTNAGYWRNRLAGLQVVGGVLVIAIATVTSPSTGQMPSLDEGAYGSSEAPPANGVHLQQVGHTDLFRILGKEVHSPFGQAMGRIVDLLVDETGQPRAAVIDFGGFLGVGTRKIAIDWHNLRFDAMGTKEAVVCDLDRDQIKAAPEYKASHDIVAIVTAPRSKQPYIAPNSGR
jgi:PRC-barrel domain